MGLEVLTPQQQEVVREWLSAEYDPITRAAVQDLVEGDPATLRDAFGARLDFGTGGMRGIMGVGTNRLNNYTLGFATQGLANYLLRTYPKGQELRVAIAYDSRMHSQEFAEDAADILTANGIRVYLYEQVRPTPLLSYTVRAYHCHAGIIITASHNPKEYNGYKVYWSDGAQVVPPHDKGIIEEVYSLKSVSQIKHGGPAELRVMLSHDADEAYLSYLQTQALHPELGEARKSVGISYTPLHGTGGKLAPAHLRRLGYTEVHPVPEQVQPDGEFPTLRSPNPEDPKALDLAVKQAQRLGDKLVLANDPDADRMSAYVCNGKDELCRLDGDQQATLIAYYLLESRRRAGTLPAHPYLIRTIVTSTLLDKIAADYGATTYSVLTGFKYIAALIAAMPPEYEYIMGCEESQGCLVGTGVRDKDGIQAAGIMADLTTWECAQGGSPMDRLASLYSRYGLLHKAQKSITLQGAEGQQEIGRRMQALRKNPPSTIAGERVVEVRDFLSRPIHQLPTPGSNIVLQAPSNVLQYVTDKGSTLTVRPSGTEPKIKYYGLVDEPFRDFGVSIPLANARLEELLEELSTRG